MLKNNNPLPAFADFHPLAPYGQLTRCASHHLGIGDPGCRDCAAAHMALWCRIIGRHLLAAWSVAERLAWLRCDSKSAELAAICLPDASRGLLAVCDSYGLARVVRRSMLGAGEPTDIWQVLPIGLARGMQ